MRTFLRTALLLALLLFLLGLGAGQNQDRDLPVSDFTEHEASQPGEGISPAIYRPDDSISLNWKVADLSKELSSSLHWRLKYHPDCHVLIQVIRRRYMEYAPSILHRLCHAEFHKAAQADPDLA